MPFIPELSTSFIRSSEFTFDGKRIQNSEDSLPIMKPFTFFITTCILTVIFASGSAENDSSVGKKGECFFKT
jgi:hypothetical protein